MNNNNYSLDILDMVSSQDDKKELLTTFISESQLCIKKLYEELQNRNLKQVSFYAHKLKTSFKLFQIREIYNPIEELEINIKTFSEIEISEFINEIDLAFNKVKNDLNEKIENSYSF